MFCQKVVMPAAKKDVAAHMIRIFHLSERTACKLAGLSRTAYQYRAKPAADDALRARLKALAVEQSAYGYLLLHGILKSEGLVVNKSTRIACIRKKGYRYPPKNARSFSDPGSQWKCPRGLISAGLWISYQISLAMAGVSEY